VELQVQVVILHQVEKLWGLKERVPMAEQREYRMAAQMPKEQLLLMQEALLVFKRQKTVKFH
jgi:hypothetical protein